MAAIVEVENVIKEYPLGKLSVRALDGVSVTFGEGEFAAIAAPSGAGKTTLLNLIGCVDVPTSGVVRIDGQATTDLSDAQLTALRLHKLGFIFQSFNLIPDLNLFDNCEVPLRYRGMPAGERRLRIEEALSQVGLGSRMKHYPSELSGGQQQRAAIARAIIHDPDVVLADELTGNLDSKAANDVMQALRQLNEDHGVTVVMVTHDPFAASFCRRVVFIRDGRPFTELRRGGSRQAFFQQLLDTLSAMGGFAS